MRRTLKPENVEPLLRGSFGRPYIHHDTVASTQEPARLLGHGGVVACELQTAGRGRMGRVWECPHGAGVMFSLSLEPRTPTELLPPLSLVVADAVCDAVGAGSGVRWPNDVVVDDRKLCGVLVEHREGRWSPASASTRTSRPTSCRPQRGCRRRRSRSRPAPTPTARSSWPTCCGRSNSATWRSSATDSPDSSTTTCAGRRVTLAGGLEGLCDGVDSSGRLVVAGSAHSSAEVTAVTVG